MTTELSVGTTFDYSVLPDDIASEARVVAARVRAREKNIMGAALETGRDLLDIKERLGHGHFMAWLEAEFGMTRQTANNYMNAAERFGDKKQTILHLPPSAVYALASPTAPEPVVRKVFAKYEAGEQVSPSVVKVMVREAREAERVAAQEAKLKPAQRRYRRDKEAERQRADEEWRQRQQAETEAANNAVEFLAERLGEDFGTFREAFLRCSAFRFADAMKAH